MRSIRVGIAAVIMLGLAVGYAASQQAALNGEAPIHALRVDTAAVKWLALAALLVTVGLGFVREKESEGDPE
ncbi:MAG: hypothetical protein ACO1SV_26050 [Fimbriimonas sp.]